MLTTGQRSRRTHLDIFWTANESGHPRLGLVVSRSQQTAVARNRLQRRLRELWRREIRPGLAAWDVVIRSRRESYRASFQALRADLRGWAEMVRP